MININELRTGNTVIYRWFEGHDPKIQHKEQVEILGLNSVNNQCLIKAPDKRKNHTWVDLRNIMPVLLTEAILKEQGFTEHDFTSGKITLSKSDQHAFCITGISESSNVRSLHILQNRSFFKTGKEIKEITRRRGCKYGLKLFNALLSKESITRVEDYMITEISRLANCFPQMTFTGMYDHDNNMYVVLVQPEYEYRIYEEYIKFEIHLRCGPIDEFLGINILFTSDPGDLPNHA